MTINECISVNNILHLPMPSLRQTFSRFSEEEICPREIQQRISVNIKVEILFFNPHDDDSGQFASSHHEG